VLSRQTVAQAVEKTQAGWKVVTASVRGVSHVRAELPNQDACDYRVCGDGDTACVSIAIADGHGGARHFRSHIGSRLAVQSALRVLQSFISDQLAAGSIQNEQVLELVKQIEAGWRSAVLSDLEQNPLTEQDWNMLRQLPDGGFENGQPDSVIAYGATLLAAAATPTHIVLLQIGDGDVLAVSATGKTTRPIPSDNRLMGNQTTSLCQPDAWKEFRTCILSGRHEFPVLLLMSTDGYANAFRTDADFLKIGRDYLALIRDRGLESLAEELPAILSEASQSGSADDITFAILHNNSSELNEKMTIYAPATPSGRRSKLVPLALLTLVTLLGAAAAGLFLYQRRAPARAPHTQPVPKVAAKPAKPDQQPPKEQAQPAITNEPPKGQQWVLDFGAGRQIPLQPGGQLSAKDLFDIRAKQPSSGPYAAVREQNHTLVLVNDSSDVWTVSVPGRKSTIPVHHGEFVELAQKVSLILHRHHASIVLR
jgi:hypothetical protein